MRRSGVGEKKGEEMRRNEKKFGTEVLGKRRLKGL
jgi:hypothetical protein